MIKLIVDEYCHDCQNFDVYLKKTNKIRAIYCKNRLSCQAIKQYLERHQKERKEND